MTFSVTQFRNLAKQDGYVILSANERKLAVLSEGE
jgi:DNA integrity scanning protein DisA with diadenylate cyclase activity